MVATLAARDLNRRERFLREVRGDAFARTARENLIGWLEELAQGDAQPGTALGDDPSIRSFGYLERAIIVARFSPGELRVLRVFFTGQDWTRRHRDRRR